jgi:YhcN/YlaJ family sporulation lipoprotein
MRYMIMLVLAAALTAGCSRAPQNDASPASPNGQNGVQMQQNVPAKPKIRDKQQVAEHLEQLAMSIPQVHGAKCVVLGNTAIVGIDVDPQLERSRVDVIKYSVAEAFRKDPYGVHAFVTADMDLNGRIAEIREDIRQGRPVAGFAEELADIIGRIVPQIPKDITPQGNPPANATDGQQMNEQL